MGPVVVLAGGQGARLGGDKPARWLGGRPLVDWALDRARRYGGPVAISVRRTGQVAMSDGLELLDSPDLEGPLAGLAAALAFARDLAAAHVLTLPCDMPWLPDDLAERLSATLADTAAAVAFPAIAGESQAVCGLWRASCLDRLDAYVATGRRSLKGFGQFVGAVDVAWRDDHADRFVNINRLEELQAAERRISGLG